MSFRSFQARLLVFFLGLLLVVQVLVFLVVNAATTQETRAAMMEDLAVGSKVFGRLIASRTDRLAEAARLLAGDYAVKAAYATRDIGTIHSAFDNHRVRIGADFMVLVAPDNRLMLDTLHRTPRAASFAFPQLIRQAEEAGEATAIVFIDRRPYQMVVVPLLAPTPVAWMGMGFEIDDQLAGELKKLTQVEVSFVSRQPDGEWSLPASTLPADLRPALVQSLARRGDPQARTFTVSLNGREYASHLTAVGQPREFGIAALLQKSEAEALAPVYRLRRTLLAIFAAGLLVSAVAGVFIARTVSRPVQTLVRGVRHIERGEYGRPIAAERPDELGELAAAINHMMSGIAEREERIRTHVEATIRAEEASRAKSQFLATMSHELRTPLNAIIGFSQVLAKGSYGELNAKQAEFVTTILGAGRHLLSLINDILDLSKIEAGRMTLDLERFDFGASLREVLATVETLARPKSIVLGADVEDGLPEVTADPGKVKQILYNLLSNAIKFTPERGSVSVLVGIDGAAAGGGPGLLRVAVVDTGIGIKPEDQERIFGAFEQVDSSYAREQQGTGLGLALTKKLVEMHGGRIWVESEGVAKKGSTFTFVIPTAPEPREPPVADRV